MKSLKILILSLLITFSISSQIQLTKTQKLICLIQSMTEKLNDIFSFIESLQSKDFQKIIESGEILYKDLIESYNKCFKNEVNLQKVTFSCVNRCYKKIRRTSMKYSSCVVGQFLKKFVEITWNGSWKKFLSLMDDIEKNCSSQFDNLIKQTTGLLKRCVSECKSK